MSADPVKAQASFKAKQNLNFPLLSDPTHKAIQKFGVWQRKQFMGRTFMGIATAAYRDIASRGESPDAGSSLSGGAWKFRPGRRKHTAKFSLTPNYPLVLLTL